MNVNGCQRHSKCYDDDIMVVVQQHKHNNSIDFYLHSISIAQDSSPLYMCQL